MTKEAYLSQVGELTRKITYHTARLARLRRDADAVSSAGGAREGSRGPKSGDAPFVHALERIEECEEELRAESELLLRLQQQVEETINRLPEERMRLVLLYKYLEGKSYFQIGDLLYVDKGTAKRWQVKALQEMTLPENPISIFS